MAGVTEAMTNRTNETNDLFPKVQHKFLDFNSNFSHVENVESQFLAARQMIEPAIVLTSLCAQLLSQLSRQPTRQALKS